LPQNKCKGFRTIDGGVPLLKYVFGLRVDHRFASMTFQMLAARSGPKPFDRSQSSRRRSHIDLGEMTVNDIDTDKDQSLLF